MLGGGAVAEGQRSGGDAGEDLAPLLAGRDALEQGARAGRIAGRQACGCQGKGKVLVAGGETMRALQPARGLGGVGERLGLAPGGFGLAAFVLQAVGVVSDGGLRGRKNVLF
ncbi:MAG TPA: hypothetical protein VMB71_05420 [Acetobacteraceae bacterium]|nr:hypothetical protein [Acetobacteraceae bacterium]